MARSRVEMLDVGQFGLPQTGAVFLLRGKRPVLVESGTAATAQAVTGWVEGLMLDTILLTHVHLDHAGGAGHIVSCQPHATVVIHARGASHLVDPARLLEGVAAASATLAPLYGIPRPVPAARVVSVQGGEVFDLGRAGRFEVVATPGHASHHVCYWEPRSRILFAGDALGNWNTRVDIPLTVPPRFDWTQQWETLDRLRALRPSAVAFTHFGISFDVRERFDQARRALVDWHEFLVRRSRMLSPDELGAEVLAMPKYASLSAPEREMVAMCIRGGLASL